MLLGAILPGMTGKFTFVDQFTSLNAPYTLVRVMSWDDSLSQGYQVVDVYTRVGLTADDYNAALSTLLGSNILVLRSVEDTTIADLVIPEVLMASVPDTSIKLYPKVFLALNLGYYQDLEQISWLQTEVQQLISALTGSTGDALIMTKSEKWLTDAEYKEIEDARIDTVDQVDSTYTKYLAVLKENENLKAKNAALEEIIIDLNAP